MLDCLVNRKREDLRGGIGASRCYVQLLSGEEEDFNSAVHSSYGLFYHLVWAPKYRRKVRMGSLWTKDYAVNSVGGLNLDTVRQYIVTEQKP